MFLRYLQNQLLCAVQGTHPSAFVLTETTTAPDDEGADVGGDGEGDDVGGDGEGDDVGGDGEGDDVGGDGEGDDVGGDGEGDASTRLHSAFSIKPGITYHFFSTQVPCA